MLSPPHHRTSRGDRIGLVVFSGGSAANSLVDVFEHVRQQNSFVLSYIIPISDNGGSSSEIIRVFGGPGIGDVRSRLVRLIPDDSPEKTAIKGLFNHRLGKGSREARDEWNTILEGTHELWLGVSSPKKELVRSLLNHFNLEVVKRTRPTSRFDFSGASIGNIFLTGARLFTGSFEAAIYLLSSVCAVPDYISVLPALNTNFANHIAAGLADGTVVIGQNDISHPSAPSNAVPLPMSGTDHADAVEDANPPGSHPALRRPAITFSKEEEEELPERIQRVWYINPYGQEIRPLANPRALDALTSAKSVIYSIGSLFTSLVPSLILSGVGDRIADPSIRTKVLILNGTLDRETGPSKHPYTALDIIGAVAGACAGSRGLEPPSEFMYSTYVTHLIYMDGPRSPAVDKGQINRLGIETLRVYGAKSEDGNGVSSRYDPKALMQALEAIIGRADRRADRSRRNTLDA
ncbi:hypothetical protein F5X68DRAFT_128776 [Plectosphaerella plurivora]|uniref:Uncharacterized protein n=1 Tax=Plectosphaerella plurivora TaxID=936078 RepID=A0A9P9AFC2_9PEZI|nr:hypothetical protein F5X68DRAFT_128776 [Plectosphaerella plurivora]